MPSNVVPTKIGGGVTFESAGAISGTASFNGSKEVPGSSTTFDSIGLGSKAGMLDLADINFATHTIPQHSMTDSPAAKIALLENDLASTVVPSIDSYGSKSTINSPATGEVNAILAAEGDGFMNRGPDSFVFGAGFGHDTSEFGDSATVQGLLDSSAAIFADLAAFKAATEPAGTDLHVDVGISSSVGFIDTIMANLGADDFRFH
jgi:hypothetical protein